MLPAGELTDKIALGWCMGLDVHLAFPKSMGIPASGVAVTRIFPKGGRIEYTNLGDPPPALPGIHWATMRYCDG